MSRLFMTSRARPFGLYSYSVRTRRVISSPPSLSSSMLMLMRFSARDCTNNLSLDNTSAPARTSTVAHLPVSQFSIVKAPTYLFFDEGCGSSKSEFLTAGRGITDSLEWRSIVNPSIYDSFESNLCNSRLPANTDLTARRDSNQLGMIGPWEGMR